MLTTRTSRLALLTILGVLLSGASLAPVASAATQRYAGPNGSGTDCSSASPCGIEEAVKGASSGDEVIVAPGGYPLTATLATPAQITVRGVAGQPRPRLLFSGPGQEGLEVTHGSTLRYVHVVQAAAAPALLAIGSSVEQLIAKGTAFPAGATASIADSVIRNSIVVSSGDDGVALATSSVVVPRAGTYRNVTAIATGSGGVAIKAFASTAAGYANVLARNVIARGGPGGHSLQARTDSSGATATITVGHSNWLGKSTVGTKTSIVEGGGNQSSAPAFVNAALGDYRQALGSATIDAGLDEAINGPLDVDGDPRQIGGIDIGADEFVVVPAVTTGPASAVSDQSATLSGSVDANGAPTSYHFEYGPTTAYGSATPPADAGSGLAVAAATLGGLSPATTYHYRLVATNAGGTTKGADQTFTTASPPPPPTPPAAPSASSSTSQIATSPPWAFAGVRLVSTRLSFGGRFVTLRLSCPAGTVGSCSGRTKLSAWRRSSSRPASTVTLGRAAFSIAPGGQAKVRVRVSRAGRRLLSRVRRLRGRDVNAARDGTGRSKTTVAAVTIRGRPR
jgi:hypothetical protein